jgi:hypothetical protein
LQQLLFAILWEHSSKFGIDHLHFLQPKTSDLCS